MTTIRTGSNLAPVAFDWADDCRGAWAALRDGAGRTVILTEYPRSLLSMLAAHALVGQAKADAEAMIEG